MPSSLRTSWALLAACALALAATAQSPSPQPVLNRALNARGGAARFQAIRTMTVAGSLSLPSGRAALLVRSAAPNLFRIELHLPEGLLVQGFDGRRAWQIDPGQKTAHLLTGAAATQVHNEALGFVDLTVAPERNQTQVAYAGKGTLRGRSYEALRFTLTTGSQFIRYLDPQTGIGFAERYPLPHGTGIETLERYRRFSGLLFPTRWVNDPDSAHPVVLAWDRVDLNVPMPNGLFTVPVSPGPVRVRIDAVYPKGEVFAVTLDATDTTTVRGAVPHAFVPGSQRQTGTIRVWLAGMDGKYRISGSKGTVTVVSGTHRQTVPVSGTIAFDGLGYPQKVPNDPAELLPIFPAQPVGVGDRWSAQSPVQESLGAGTGVYAYHVDAIHTAGNGHVLVTFDFQVRGENLHPPAPLSGWTSTIAGRGQMVWDCTAHEKFSARYQLTYTAARGTNRIREVVTNREHMRRLTPAP